MGWYFILTPAWRSRYTLGSGSNPGNWLSGSGREIAQWRSLHVGHLIFSRFHFLIMRHPGQSLRALIGKLFSPIVEDILQLCSSQKSHRYLLKSWITVHKCDKRYEFHTVHWKSDSLHFKAKWPCSLPILANMVVKSFDISYYKPINYFERLSAYYITYYVFLQVSSRSSIVIIKRILMFFIILEWLKPLDVSGMKE